MRRIVVVLSAAAAVLAIGPAPAAAEETPVFCGQVVTGTVKVANDLDCVDTDALIVGSDNTVIDLNGHRFTCTGAGYQGSCQGEAVGVARDPEPEHGVAIDGFDNVHVFTSVPGAEIDGFDDGVFINRSSNVKVEHLILTGPPAPAGPGANPRPPTHGVLVQGASCGGGHIHIGTGEKRGNDASNHNQGVAINGDCVNVVHNRLHHNNSNAALRFGIPVVPPSNGLLLAQAAHNVVRGNEITRNGDEDETVDAGLRIRREQSTDNLVTNNDVSQNFGDGILLEQGANANFILNNTMLLNGGPLSGSVFYDAAGRGAPGGPPGSEPLNEWNQNNRCLTQNEEVPPGTCEPDDVPPGEG
ncbi:MAG: right-handed parallel beta-helix repeat-containing protein [Actinomycetota bacterium]|nr:right-handed parallel beta-helix repeat-containing protein [Actinomycetota bacterium]